MKIVLKWDVPVDDKAHIIGGGKVLHAECQYGPDRVQVWTLEEAYPDDELPAITARSVMVFATGITLPENVGPHVGSVVTDKGHLVWHLFEHEG